MNTVIRMETAARMSKIVICNRMVFLCGQVADDAGQGIVTQTKSVLDKVDALLDQAGSDREHMVSATIYLRDMKDFDSMNSVWDAWVPKGEAPARACVEARLADPDLLVEISIIAALRE